jgi:hypothetical protein
MEQDLGCHHAGKPKGKRGRPQSAVLNRAAAKAALLWFSSLHGGYCCRDPMHKCLTGLDVDKPQAEDVFDYDDMTHAKVIGKISAPHASVIWKRFAGEKSAGIISTKGARRLSG